MKMKTGTGLRLSTYSNYLVLTDYRIAICKTTTRSNSSAKCNKISACEFWLRRISGRREGLVCLVLSCLGSPLVLCSPSEPSLQPAACATHSNHQQLGVLVLVILILVLLVIAKLTHACPQTSTP
jgi:hypothetical protein